MESVKIVENPQNSEKQPGEIRLKWKEVPIGACCGGCAYETVRGRSCNGISFPGGKDCLDLYRETGKNMILVEDKL